MAARQPVRHTANTTKTHCKMLLPISPAQLLLVTPAPAYQEFHDEDLYLSAALFVKDAMAAAAELIC